MSSTTQPEQQQIQGTSTGNNLSKDIKENPDSKKEDRKASEPPVEDNDQEENEEEEIVEKPASIKATDPLKSSDNLNILPMVVPPGHVAMCPVPAPDKIGQPGVQFAGNMTQEGDIWVYHEGNHEVDPNYVFLMDRKALASVSQMQQRAVAEVVDINKTRQCRELINDAFVQIVSSNDEFKERLLDADADLAIAEFVQQVRDQSGGGGEVADQKSAAPNSKDEKKGTPAKPSKAEKPDKPLRSTKPITIPPVAPITLPAMKTEPNLTMNQKFTLFSMLRNESSNIVWATAVCKDEMYIKIGGQYGYQLREPWVAVKRISSEVQNLWDYAREIISAAIHKLGLRTDDGKKLLKVVNRNEINSFIRKDVERRTRGKGIDVFFECRLQSERTGCVFDDKKDAWVLDSANAEGSGIPQHIALKHLQRLNLEYKQQKDQRVYEENKLAKEKELKEKLDEKQRELEKKAKEAKIVADAKAMEKLSEEELKKQEEELKQARAYDEAMLRIKKLKNELDLKTKEQQQDEENRLKAEERKIEESKNLDAAKAAIAAELLQKRKDLLKNEEERKIAWEKSQKDREFLIIEEDRNRERELKNIERKRANDEAKAEQAVLDIVAEQKAEKAKMEARAIAARAKRAQEEIDAQEAAAHQLKILKINHQVALQRKQDENELAAKNADRLLAFFNRLANPEPDVAAEDQKSDVKALDANSDDDQGRVAPVPTIKLDQQLVNRMIFLTGAQQIAGMDLAMVGMLEQQEILAKAALTQQSFKKTEQGNAAQQANK